MSFSRPLGLKYALRTLEVCHNNNFEILFFEKENQVEYHFSSQVFSSKNLLEGAFGTSYTTWQTQVEKIWYVFGSF